MTSQPMDYRDWLIRQQQEHIRQRFEAVFELWDASLRKSVIYC
jgi:hypothetical protein